MLQCTDLRGVNFLKKKFVFILLLIIPILIFGIFKFHIKTDSKNDNSNITESENNTVDNSASTGNASQDQTDSAAETIKGSLVLKTQGTLQANTKAGSFVLVNRNSILAPDYIPENLTVPKVKFIPKASPSVKQMSETASAALEKLFYAAAKSKIYLLSVSGYRDYYYQESLYNSKVSTDGKTQADKYVAQPGTSEHQTGLAMDIVSTEYNKLDEGFVKTRAYKWLIENCSKYGFILRYPEGKQAVTGYSFEPWHFRYVGISAAEDIMKNSITLEEYINNK